MGHPSAEHVIVDSDADHGLSDTAADLGQDLLWEISVRVGGGGGDKSAPWGSGSE